MSSIASLIAPGTAYVPLRLSGRPIAQKAVVLVLGIAFLTASSWLTVWTQPVPITMQTFAVLMVGALCGWRLGLATVVAWLALAIQFPLLSEYKTMAMVVTTHGYLAGFVVMAAFVGFMAERGWTARPIPAFLVLLVAEAICFGLGAAWLSIVPIDAEGHTLGLAKAIQYGVTPFLFADLVKVLLAVAVLTAFRRALPRA